MRGKIALAVGIGLLAAAPASAGKSVVFDSLEVCMWTGAAGDHWGRWDYACLPTSNGKWELVWINNNANKR